MGRDIHASQPTFSATNDMGRLTRAEMSFNAGKAKSRNLNDGVRVPQMLFGIPGELKLKLHCLAGFSR